MNVVLSVANWDDQNKSYLFVDITNERDQLHW